MSKLEIKKLFEIRKGRYLPCGLNIKEKLWWRFMPGVIINVAWPAEKSVIVDVSDPRWDGSLGTRLQEGFSADPNDIYRPWLEKHVGRQNWDWNWGLVGNDSAENRLTIKIRQKHAKYATIAAIQWA